MEVECMCLRPIREGSWKEGGRKRNKCGSKTYVASLGLYLQ
jgi:hypothetical protein